MRTDRFRGILLSTLLVTSLMVPLSILALTPAAEALSKAPDLFISEYIEGSSYNKALEIANYTCSTVDLSDYQVELYSNGHTYIGAQDNLSGTLNSGHVYVICHPSADAAILAIADQISSVCNWNGDDGIVLRKKSDNSVVDSIGQYGVDPGSTPPGWPGGGGNQTQVRKDNILQGDTNFNDAFTFATEWDAYGIDNFDFLGWHYAKGTWFEKHSMPDLGQHSVNWCWAAAAANSIYWWSQNGYPELIDDPADPTPNDNAYIHMKMSHPPPHAPQPDLVYRLLHEIAVDCLFPGYEPENELTIDNTYCEPIFDDQYFFGLQEFIDEQFAPLPAPLRVHEIVDNDNLWGVPPEDGVRVIYRPPTLEDYQRELERCQDVLLWLDFRHYEDEPPYYYEDTDHVVTGVGFSYDNAWIIVSDPWTTGRPDHGNDLHHAPENEPYENLAVLSEENEPLWVLYDGQPVYVPKLIFISPFEPECSVDVTIEPEHKRGTPGTWLTFVVRVHNTGDIEDDFLLWVEPDGWPMENIYFEESGSSTMLLENVEPCVTENVLLYVHIPENAEPRTHKEIVVWAESEFCGATDNDNALVQVVSKYLHNIEPGAYPLEPGNWVSTIWHEIYPIYSQYYHLSSWEDTDNDGMTSPGDIIDITNLDNENDIEWHYVKDVTCTLVLEEEMFSPPDLWWYLEFEDGWENYCSAWWDPFYTQWNEIYPTFCNRYLLVEWIDGEPYDGVLGWCDWVWLVDKVTWEPLPFPLHVVEIVTDLVLSEEIVEEPWTGTAVFSLENLYTVNVEKILDLYQGSKLVVKFYTYGDAYENENVVETFSPPWHVEENELVPHPEDIGVKKAKLVLTDGAGVEIDNIATFTVTRNILYARIVDIYLEWPFADANRRNELFAEISDIYLQWAFAPP